MATAVSLDESRIWVLAWSLFEPNPLPCISFLHVVVNALVSSSPLKGSVYIMPYLWCSGLSTVLAKPEKCKLDLFPGKGGELKPRSSASWVSVFIAQL